MRSGDKGQVRWTWLGHPVTLLALLALILNDHVWKARHPGLLTGKLSDVAGLVLTPAVLGTAIGLVRIALGRRKPAGPATVFGAAVFTGVGFVLVKTSPAAAAVASGLWSLVVGPSEVRADVTDLVALPGLGLAVWIGLGAVADMRTRRRQWGTVVTLVLLPAAALAIAATSAPQYPDAVTVQVLNGRFVAGEANAYHGSRGPDLWRISYDGGFVWHYADPHDTQSLMETSVPREGCAPEEPTHCYRVVAAHLRVEETLDGGRSWRVSWEITDEVSTVIG